MVPIFLFSRQSPPSKHQIKAQPEILWSLYRDQFVRIVHHYSVLLCITLYYYYLYQPHSNNETQSCWLNIFQIFRIIEDHHDHAWLICSRRLMQGTLLKYPFYCFVWSQFWTELLAVFFFCSSTDAVTILCNKIGYILSKKNQTYHQEIFCAHRRAYDMLKFGRIFRNWYATHICTDLHENLLITYSFTRLSLKFNKDRSFCCKPVEF